MTYHYSDILVPLLATLGGYGLYKLASLIYREWTSPLNVLPGPKSSSFLYGNMKEIFEVACGLALFPTSVFHSQTDMVVLQQEASVMHDKWVEEFGSTIKYQGYLGLNRLYTTDTKAVNHVLMHSDIYQQTEAGRVFLSQILGNGVLIVQGDKHRQQRRVMNPAFGTAQVRELTEVFVQKSLELRDVWLAEISKENNNNIDVLSWLGKMTLDVIGQAGFNYEFNALHGDEEKNELSKAFSVIFKSTNNMRLIPIVRQLVPWLRWLPAEGDSARKHAMKTMTTIGKQLLHESKARVYAEQGGKVGKDSVKGRDLLSLLVKANMSEDLPPSHRMSDEDVLAQVPTFLVAGHETTSTATTWALLSLTQYPEIQVKLREELLTIGTDNPTMEELNSLPYLDAVLREVLRINPPVPFSFREAAQDDVIPLSQPVQGRRGEIIDHVRVRKGQLVLIPILALNRQKSIWGEDAAEFRPDRWKNVPSSVMSIPGVWGNMMTFLGGPRACIGYRFSLVETKALLFTLIRAFEFDLAVPSSDIGKKTGIVQRPYLKSKPEAGNQLPLILKSVIHN